MKKPYYKRWWFWTLTILLVIVIIGIISSGNEDTKQTTSNSKPKTVTNTTVQVKTPVKTFDFATADLTKDNVKKAITNSNKQIADKITDIKISNGNVNITVYDKDALTIKLYLRGIQPDSADVFEALFKNKNVKQVIYQSDVDTNDSYGNTNKQTAMTCTLIKQDADKIKNWNNFRTEPMSQYYSVVSFQLAPESKIQGLHKAWSEIYE